jgi:cytochrome P450
LRPPRHPATTPLGDAWGPTTAAPAAAATSATRTPAAHGCPFDFAEALEFDPALQALLDGDAVSRIRLPYGEADAWLATRYEDVKTVTTDRRFSRSAIVGRDYPRLTPEPIIQPEAINVVDPPDSARLRSLVAKAFAPRHLERMRARTQAAVDTLLDGMARHGSPADLMEHLAGPLPLITICEVLDIPEDDREQLRTHARTMMDLGAATKTAAAEAKSQMRAYFDELSARRRAKPGEDLISTLATASDGGAVLSAGELSVMSMVLMITGQDTTSFQLGNLAFTLLSRPPLLEAVRADPAAFPRIMHEMLRVIPFRKGVGIPRIALEDVRLGETLIRAGDYVHVSYLTANRDPGKFDRPGELDPERTGPLHMTFGWGAHHCLGAPLALVELEVALTSLLARFPGLAPAVPPGAVAWNTASIWRYPQALPVSW